MKFIILSNTCTQFLTFQKMNRLKGRERVPTQLVERPNPIDGDEDQTGEIPRQGKPTDPTPAEFFCLLAERETDNRRQDEENRNLNCRRINVSGIEKMPGDITSRVTWNIQWKDFCYLERIDGFPLREQLSAFRMTLSSQMLQTVEFVLGINQSSLLTPSGILDKIQQHIRNQRRVALDRMEFEKCRQEVNESFDDFYIRLP